MKAFCYYLSFMRLKEKEIKCETVLGKYLKDFHCMTLEESTTKSHPKYV